MVEAPATLPTHVHAQRIIPQNVTVVKPNILHAVYLASNKYNAILLGMLPM
jgi:hypothetical protein